MPRTADAGAITYLDNNQDYSLAMCYRIVRRDATVFAFTDHNENIDIDLGDGQGVITYLADTVIEQSELESKTNLGTSNVEISMVLLETNSFDQEDITLGLFGDALLDAFEVRWDIPTPTVMRAFCGYLSEAEIHDNYIVVNYRSLSALYDQGVTRTIRRGCDYELGLFDRPRHRCHVELTAPEWTVDTAFTARALFDANTEAGTIVKPTTQTGYWFITYTGGTTDGSTEPTWPTTVDATVVDNDITWTTIEAREYNGTVTAVTDNRQFTDTNITFTADFFRFGYIIWDTGNNAGKRVEITTNDAVVLYQLFERMMQNIQVGDTFTAHVGCDKFKTTCKDKFDNVFWFGGFDDAPGALDIIQTPSLGRSG